MTNVPEQNSLLSLLHTKQHHHIHKLIWHFL
uniref:Uncharacterized protein n=1 Tax=Anguilla anguilla TaxID=7936 RepID=A0A0E9TA39_ANGAN